MAPSTGYDQSISTVWPAAIVFVPWDLLCYYGDRRVVERHYETMKRFAESSLLRQADGKPEIDPEQAAIVRRIFSRFLLGHSVRQITTDLMADGIKTATGKTVWHDSVVQKMLCNEKYMGDCMLQKYFTEDFLTGKKARNRGQRDRYYVHDSHQGIVSKERFLEVACEMNRRKSMTVAADGNMVKKNRKYKPQNTLGNILECEECGAAYRRRTERGKVVYRCATRIEKGREACKESPTIEEEWIETEIGKKVCGGEYDEEVVKKNVDRVLVGKDGGIKILFV